MASYAPQIASNVVSYGGKKEDTEEQKVETEEEKEEGMKERRRMSLLSHWTVLWKQCLDQVLRS